MPLAGNLNWLCCGDDLRGAAEHPRYVPPPPGENPRPAIAHSTPETPAPTRTLRRRPLTPADGRGGRRQGECCDGHERGQRKIQRVIMNN
ncbi:hypothetical protein MTP99_003555 [Tenebrio molitor]|nr:hypothetical protein MTP99_003555 [Tenebrio molitor]